jgi:hypothetical protein
MQELAWLGSVAGACLLLLTGSSVIKTLLIPRNLSSGIGTGVARTMLVVYRMITASPDNTSGSPAGTDTPLRMPG